jgi:hypothetical protein
LDPTWISPLPPPELEPVVIDISPKALGPTRGLGAVLGRYALKEPGDCDVARRGLNGAKDDESQGSRHTIQFGLRWVASTQARFL